jgi:hypothetical protein
MTVVGTPSKPEAAKDDDEISIQLEGDEDVLDIANIVAGGSSGPPTERGEPVEVPTKKHRKKRHRHDRGHRKESSSYGFGELDHFVLFHDDFDALGQNGRELRLQNFEEEQRADPHISKHAVQDGEEEGSASPSKDEGMDLATTSSCVSIEVDEDFDFMGIVQRGAKEELEDDVVSIADPRTLRTLHVPLQCAYLALLCVELYLITGHYRVKPGVCSSWVMTSWWVVWLVDFAVMEPISLSLVWLFRWLLREPHEEDAQGRSRPDPGTGKRGLQWWKGRLLHPYDGETRNR